MRKVWTRQKDETNSADSYQYQYSFSFGGIQTVFLNLSFNHIQQSDWLMTMVTQERGGKAKMWTQVFWLLSGTSGKEPACQCKRHKDAGSIPDSGRTPWRRKQQPTPVFLPGESHGQRSLVDYSPWGCKELDMTERVTHTAKILHASRPKKTPKFKTETIL